MASRLHAAGIGRQHLDVAGRLRLLVSGGGPTKGVVTVRVHPDDLEEARKIFRPSRLEDALSTAGSDKEDGVGGSVKGSAGGSVKGSAGGSDKDSAGGSDKDSAGCSDKDSAGGSGSGDLNDSLVGLSDLFLG